MSGSRALRGRKHVVSASPRPIATAVGIATYGTHSTARPTCAPLDATTSAPATAAVAVITTVAAPLLTRWRDTAIGRADGTAMNIRYQGAAATTPASETAHRRSARRRQRSSRRHCPGDEGAGEHTPHTPRNPSARHHCSSAMAPGSHQPPHAESGTRTTTDWCRVPRGSVVSKALGTCPRSVVGQVVPGCLRHVPPWRDRPTGGSADPGQDPKSYARRRAVK